MAVFYKYQYTNKRKNIHRLKDFVAQGPVAQGPVAQGPVAQGPVAQGPVAE